MSDLREMFVIQADTAGAPGFDLDDLVAAGDRRLRRRRVSTLAGAAVAVAAAIALAVLPGGGTRDDGSPAPPAGPGEAQTRHRSIAYIDRVDPGGLHVGDRVVRLDDLFPRKVPPGDVERRMVYLDNTDAGVVLTTHDGRIWFTDGDRPTSIGRLGGRTSIMSDDTVVSGTSSTLAAWYDATQRSFVVHDTARGEQVARIPCRGCIGEVRGGAPDLAVVGDHVYWPGRDQRLMRWDAATGRSRPTSRAAYLQDLRSSPRGLVVGRTFASGVPSTGIGLEPVAVHGRLVAFTDRDPPTDALTMFVTGSREPLELRLPAGSRAAGAAIFDWLDDSHVALLATGDGPVEDVLVCRVPSGPCRVAVPEHGHRYAAHLTFP